MTSQEDELTGRGTHRKTNSQEDELGTAQPQLVFKDLLQNKVICHEGIFSVKNGKNQNESEKIQLQ